MSTPVPLSKLVDLALGTPEIGAVNFTVLHSLLHAMLKQLKIQDVKADIDNVDREFLSTGVVSEVESEVDVLFGLGDKTQRDSTAVPSAKGKTPPYHYLERKVDTIAKKLEELNALPTNEQLFEQAKQEGCRTMAEMWQNMQLKKRVDANEDGVSKLMSMMEDLISETQLLKDANKYLQDKIKDLNMDDLLKRLNDLEKFMNDVNDQLSQLPTADDLALQFVTWPGLEDALNGVRDDMGNLPLISKVVFDTSMQTDDQQRPLSGSQKSRPTSAKAPSPQPSVSRPTSSKTGPASRTISRMSNASSAHSGPSINLLECLEQLGTLSTDHANLVIRVQKLEEEMKNKLDKGALDDLMEQITTLYSVTNEPMVIHVPEIKRVEVSSIYSQTDPEPEPVVLKPEPVVEKPEPEPVVEKPEPEPVVEKPEPVATPIQKVEIITKVVEKPVTVITKTEMSDDILERINQLKEELEALREGREKDSDAMQQIKEAILELQAEDEKLQNTTQNIIKENNRINELLQSLQEHAERLQETKADKEYVAMEVDVKADKRQLDKKVNHSLFDSTTNDLNKLIQEILEKLTGNEDSWKDALKALENDIDGKLDRLELESLKNWLESRLKALNKKIIQNSGEWMDDDAAGLRKQLLLKFNCLSCDRPVDIMPNVPMPSLPNQNGMPATRSPRPYTTYELDQIRQHARNFHNFNNPEIGDYYASVRQCGGGHTLTYPHKRTTRTTQMGSFYREDFVEPKTSPVMQKGEVDVQGVDGQIYKGRMDRLRGSTTQHPKPPTTLNGRVARPMSARGPQSPRPMSGHRHVRPQSALPGSSRHSMDSSRTTPVPADDDARIETEMIQIDVPINEVTQEAAE